MDDKVAQLLEVQRADPGDQSGAAAAEWVWGKGALSCFCSCQFQENVALASSLSLFLPTETFACWVSTSLTALADNG